MKQKQLISVIIPSYNSERFIIECIESVRNQTYTNLEIICVDASSSDGTRVSLDELALIDNRITVITSDEKSYGYQMNLGIKAASGDYIGIVESDDTLVMNAYEKLCDAICRTNADYAKGLGRYFIKRYNYSWDAEYIPMQRLMNEEEASILLPQTLEVFGSDFFLWNGIYKRDLMEKVHFNESPGAAFQDISALFQIFSFANKGAYIREPVYNYRQDNEGASSYNRNGFKFIEDEYDVIKIEFPDMDKNQEKVCLRRKADHVLNRFYFMAASGVWWVESEDSIYRLRRELMSAFDSGIIGSEDFPQNDIEELDLLFEDPVSLFEHEKKKLEEDLRHCRQLVDRYKDSGCVIFGCGSLGNCLRSIFLANDVPIHAFCDNAALHQGKSIGGIQVLAPDECIGRFRDADYVIANKDHFLEIRDQLTGMGVGASKIELFHSVFPGVLFMNAYIDRNGG